MIYYHNCDFCLSCHFNLDWCEPITGFPFMPPASRRHRISPLVNVCPNQHCWSTWSTSHCSINWYQPAAVFNQRCNDSRQRQQEYYGLRDQNSPRAAHVQSYSIIVNLWKLFWSRGGGGWCNLKTSNILDKGSFFWFFLKGSFFQVFKNVE